MLINFPPLPPLRLPRPVPLIIFQPSYETDWEINVIKPFEPFPRPFLLVNFSSVSDKWKVEYLATYDVTVGFFPPERVFIVVCREISVDVDIGFFPFPRPTRVVSDFRSEL
jgi:hypothetical protein